MRNRKFWFGFLIVVCVILVLGIFGFYRWTGNSSPPTPEALASLISDTVVHVETDPWLTFIPLEIQPTAGFIIYPGGFVETAAYAPTARAIAEAGYLVVITPMPLNLAVLNSNVASEVIEEHPEITSWAIGGHSLGGVMAASYTAKNPSKITGLVLWASYLSDGTDLSNDPIQVTSIYGTLDGLATPEKVLTAKPVLPSDTTWIPIEGGNHAQFGWYGPQEGDNPATISQEEQQSQIIKATISLLQKLEMNHE